VTESAKICPADWEIGTQTTFGDLYIRVTQYFQEFRAKLGDDAMKDMLSRANAAMKEALYYRRTVKTELTAKAMNEIIETRGYGFTVIVASDGLSMTQRQLSIATPTLNQDG
jgi:hypothetical protein